jgi:hypothetical protein
VTSASVHLFHTRVVSGRLRTLLHLCKILLCFSEYNACFLFLIIGELNFNKKLEGFIKNYICVCICVRVSVYACIYVFMFVCMHVYVLSVITCEISPEIQSGFKGEQPT